MGRVLRFIETRLLPRGWMDLLRQIVLFAGALLLYDLVRGLVAGDNPYKPFGDAMRIIDLERTLHVFVEPSVQAWALQHALADRHRRLDLPERALFGITLGVLVFIYARRNESFYFVRNMFMIAMGLALIGYSLYPTAPPRLMPEWGFTDAIPQFVTGGTGFVDDGPTKAFLNLYAAVPSMHVCFAVMIGGSMSRLIRVASREDPVGALPAADHVRRRGHRQPLPDRRVPRGPHRRRIRAAGAEAARAGQAGRLGVRPRHRLTMATRCAPRREHAEQPARARANGAPRRARAPRTGSTTQELMRNRLIESRLTPNAISLTGFALNLAAAGLIVGRMFFLAGIAFIVGSIMDTLDGRYSRMSGKGTPFGAFLDSTLDRLEEGIVLIAVGAYFASRHNQVAAAADGGRRARLPDGVLHPRPRRGAWGRVQGRPGHAPGARRHPLDRARVRQGRGTRPLRVAGAGRVRARRSSPCSRRFSASSTCAAS